MTTFADQLVLARWALKQLGVDDFDRLSEMLRAPEFEGWSDDGGSRFAQQLVARLPKQGRSVDDDMLGEYDGNIVGHWKHITRKRNTQGPTLYASHFQYLALLFTAIYLDRYFRFWQELLASLNGFLSSAASPPTLASRTGAKDRTEEDGAAGDRALYRSGPQQDRFLDGHG